MYERQKKRNRPDKDGKDRVTFMRYRNRIIRDCKDEGYINCSICGLPINLSLPYPHPWSLTIDHIMPIAKGGETTEENLQPAHFKCNRRKGEKLGITIEQINELREEQGSGPIKTVERLGYVSKLSPKELQEDAAQEDSDRARRGFVQSANWRTY